MPPSDPWSSAFLPRLKSVNRVLVADDEPGVGEMLHDTLELFQFEVTIAQESDSAIAMQKEFRPAVALLDIRLGERDGIELAMEMKKIDPHLPVILMTAYPSMDLALSLMEKDIQDFLAKPIDTAYLLQTIWKAVKKRDLTVKNNDLLLYLKTANASLARLNSMKGKFLSVVSHDLRTPLSAIQGYCDLLEMNPNLPQEKKERGFKILKDSIQQMNYLITNLMDLVRIESGKLNVSKIPMDYALFCRDSCEAMTPMALQRKLTLKWTVPDTHIMILGDPNRLSQLATNLISNAFKHTKPGGFVELRVSCQDGMVLTEVTDNGEGIPKEKIPHLFQEYFQVEEAMNQNIGVGLGLYIAQEIVESHNGKISVSSDGPGKGATFHFTLPLSET